jgi:hypothetical protein
MITVIKPAKVLTTRADIRKLTDKSNAQLQWALSLINPHVAHPDGVPKGAWKGTLSDVTFFNHQHMTRWSSCVFQRHRRHRYASRIAIGPTLNLAG